MLTIIEIDNYLHNICNGSIDAGFVSYCSSVTSYPYIKENIDALLKEVSLGATARTNLCNCYLRVVAYYAYKVHLSFYDIELADLISAGNCKLAEILSSQLPDEESNLSTHIEKEIKKFFYNIVKKTYTP